ncbi:MAG: DUF87 domain-containing protein [Cyanobacteria bacterium P01_H01_bin.74]
MSNTFSVKLADFAATGERDAILASSGMGKSYLTGVLLEETLENGCLVCVIDPEGEHFTLAERYPMLIIGGDHGSLPLDENAIDLYLEAMLENRLSAVFDLSEYMDEEQQQFYAKIADQLFQLEQKYKTKIRLVIEEAQIYAPQRTGGTPSMKRGKKMLADPVQASQKIAKRGRKRAIDSLWATQRPASLNKDILSQCNRFWFGGIQSEQDYKAVKPYLNEAGISFAAIKALKPGEFYFYAKGQTTQIKVRKRHCKHAGATPEAGQNFSAAATHEMDATMKALTAAVNRRTVKLKEEDAEINRLKAVIRDLEKEKRKLEQELEEERMATKVIERLGATPSNSQLKTKRIAAKLSEPSK